MRALTEKNLGICQRRAVTAEGWGQRGNAGWRARRRITRDYWDGDRARRAVGMGGIVGYRAPVAGEIALEGAGAVAR